MKDARVDPDLPTLYAQAAELEGAARAEFFRSLEERSPELAREVGELLAVAEQDARWLSAPAWRTHEPNPVGEIPATIGPFRVLSELGRGGAGRVFLAEEVSETFVRRVAVKVLSGALLDSEARERFRTESRLLAGLEHPGIARLYDTGTTPEGVPYLVMEYVDGSDLTTYAARSGLGTRDRVVLFLQVLEAVQFAHRHLIVHRDLKPANLLVDTEGRVKLLDFGIAKLVGDSEAAASAALTRTGFRWLTPAYAAPEQVRGEPTTTAADIYSLGVVLYELLTGKRPHETTGVQLTADILSREPVAPSRALGTAESTVIPRDLEGDLDAIVLYALRKEPEARYRSAEAFAEDLNRHLEGFPVAARQRTRRYRWSKFVRRNRGSIAAGGAVFLALAGGLGAALWQAQKAAAAQAAAESRFADLRQLASALMFDITAAIVPLDGSAAAVELTLERALEYLDRLDARGGGVELEEELAAGYERMGEVAANMPVFGGGSGNWEKGAAAFERALELRRNLAAGAGVEERFRLGRLLTIYCGTLRSRRDPAKMEAVCREAVQQFDGMVADHPERRDLKLGLATALTQLVHTLGAHYGVEAKLALPELERARALWLEIGGDPLETISNRRGHAWGLSLIGETLRRAGHLEDAAKLAEWGLRATAEPPPVTLSYSLEKQRELRSLALEAAARVHWDLDRKLEAADELDESFDLRLASRRKDQFANLQIQLFDLAGSRARLAGEIGDVERGERALADGYRLIGEVRELWKADTLTWSSGLIEVHRGAMYRAASERPGVDRTKRELYRTRARRAYRQAIEILQSLVREGADPFNAGDSIAQSREGLAALADS